MSVCLILSAGVGTRMHNPTIHKGLLPISGKAIISHIIENVDCEEFIIAVGHKSKQIKDYCASAHPNLNIRFVDVKNYDGPNSGPGHSMFCCKEFLQKPFYLVTADSFLTNKLPPIDCDWAGISHVDEPENYATCSIDHENFIIDFKNKDKDNSFDYAFTGVLAVKNYKAFWNKFEEYSKNRNDKEVEVVGTLYSPGYTKLKAVSVPWKDVGTKFLYEQVKSTSTSFVPFELSKININECTYKINNKIIKISTEESICKKKERSQILHGLIPTVKDKNLTDLISYDFVTGKTLYEHDDFQIYKDFLLWCEKELFTKKNMDTDLRSCCKNFYKNKTENRVELYCKQYHASPQSKYKINGIECDSLKNILDKINWDSFVESHIPSAFHGDLNFGNVILSDDNKFFLIDWRDDFEGQNYGDLYYDLAKLYAGSLVNFMSFSHLEKLMIQDCNDIFLEDCSTPPTRRFIEYYEQWIEKQGYNLENVKILAALTYINMSPLHPGKYGHYLFYKSILHLNQLVIG